ncbi:Adrenodoxin mitochondrial [Teratosphaeria destructans]|uniref:Adrenodoxin mitochondrial n=1 Tax=Teratosphaeria destructans TaxID=418781 RepID=A0A9W7STR0_9PEZI|nr:Adrenodoxin mitochondrial [Teratosphaeria destructans]
MVQRQSLSALGSVTSTLCAASRDILPHRARHPLLRPQQRHLTTPHHLPRPSLPSCPNHRPSPLRRRHNNITTTTLPRPFSSTPTPHHGHLTPPQLGEERHITFVDKDGREHTFAVADGDNLLDIAQAHDLEMEGACGGSCACSTCHVIVEDEAMFDRMEEPSDDENDMLDLAFGLTETSRLGCQVVMRRELDGLRVCMTFSLGVGRDGEISRFWEVVFGDGSADGVDRLNYRP